MDQPVQVILLGASGDLARRKLLPALASLASRGQLDESSRVVAVARREMDPQALAEDVRAGLGVPTSTASTSS